MTSDSENARVYPEALSAGTEVGTWRVVERLGVGGFGAVYRVEDVARPGTFYALKLSLRPGDARAEREVTLLMDKAVHPSVVRFHACGRWPDSETGFLYFVMDWVKGQPLDAWAEQQNPSFHDVAQVAGKVALAFDALHGAGVLHRDLKPAHILIRETDGAPVVIDFGMGDYAGATTITEQTMPPGTVSLRSPEAVRFYREHHGEPGMHYESQPTDDLYALGVCLYRVVTGHYPFSSQLPPDLLYLAIEGQAPAAPESLNPRIPPALCQVILRLLAKSPRDRLPTGAALHEALASAMTSGVPSSWEACLFEEQGPSPRPAGPERRLRRPEAPRDSDAPLAPEGRALSSSRLRRRETQRGVEFPKSATLVPGRVLPGVVLASLLMFAAWRMLAPEPQAPPGGEPDSAARVHPVLANTSPSRDVALPAAADAADPPSAEATPAVAAPVAALPKEDSPVMKQTKPPALSLKKLGRTAVGVVVACLDASCSSPQVRPESHRPEPEACPPGAAKAMEELGIKVGSVHRVVFTVASDSANRRIPIRAGEDQVRLMEGDWGRLPYRSVVTGRLYIGDRVYGRFTSVRTRDGSATYPICAEVFDVYGGRGSVKEPGSDATTTLVYAIVDLRAVDHFE